MQHSSQSRYQLETAKDIPVTVLLILKRPKQFQILDRRLIVLIQTFVVLLSLISISIDTNKSIIK
jgi:hypothetical protein